MVNIGLFKDQMRRLLDAYLLLMLTGWGGITFAADDLQLSLEIPACKMPSSKPLPTKYYGLAKRWKEFNWAKSAIASDMSVYGTGWEGLKGSGFYSNFYFYKLDVNSDGFCDWLLVYQAPALSIVSRDFEILNTFYLGHQSGWQRIGAPIPESKPDTLGTLKSRSNQLRYSFFADTPLVIYSHHSNTRYIVGTFSHADNDHPTARKTHRYGYRIYRWDQSRNTLQDLDKWEPGSTAAQVYAFLKQHGAIDPTQHGKDRIVKFDPDFERAELDRGCRDAKSLAWSSHFVRLCKNPALHPSVH